MAEGVLEAPIAACLYMEQKRKLQVKLDATSAEIKQLQTKANHIEDEMKALDETITAEIQITYQKAAESRLAKESGKKSPSTLQPVYPYKVKRILRVRQNPCFVKRDTKAYGLTDNVDSFVFDDLVAALRFAETGDLIELENGTHSLWHEDVRILEINVQIVGIGDHVILDDIYYEWNRGIFEIKDAHVRIANIEVRVSGDLTSPNIAVFLFQERIMLFT